MYKVNCMIIICNFCLEFCFLLPKSLEPFVLPATPIVCRYFFFSIFFLLFPKGLITDSPQLMRLYYWVKNKTLLQTLPTYIYTIHKKVDLRWEKGPAAMATKTVIFFFFCDLCDYKKRVVVMENRELRKKIINDGKLRENSWNNSQEIWISTIFKKWR